MSRGDLKHLFLGESSSLGGQNLSPFNANPNTPERTAFDQGALGLSPDQVSKYWIDRRIRGQAAAPRSAPSPDVLVKVVSKLPNAITYVPLNLVTPDLKVLKVDGKLPSDPGYPIVER